MVNVRTYIQSGNVLFRSPTRSINALTERIESGLSTTFDYQAQAVVLSHRKYNQMMEVAPRYWGADSEQRHNILFTMGNATPKQVLSVLPDPKSEIERVSSCSGAIFWSIFKSQVTKSSFVKLPQQAIYKQLTIRNHNTAFKLRSLFEEI